MDDPKYNFGYLLVAGDAVLKSILFFNNKGGVGKTTLACNLVSYLNIYKGKRVLLVDADPQCNSTQAILSEELCEEIYLLGNSRYNTLLTALNPLLVGEPEINRDIRPILASENRFNTDIIAGHPQMSIIEDRLSEAWSHIRGRNIGGFRTTNWCHHLTSKFAEDYDYIVYDVGPSLGAINRSIILSCDYLVTPFGCDIFSLLGIRNIASWIRSWKDHYDTAIREAIQDNPTATEFNLITNTNEKFRFAGFSIQQYLTKTFKTGPRPVKSYDRIMSQIPDTVFNSMEFIFSPTIDRSDLELGHIPYINSLIPMAQAAKSPVHQLRAGDGIVGSQYKNAKDYGELLNLLCDRLLQNIGE